MPGVLLAQDEVVVSSGKSGKGDLRFELSHLDAAQWVRVLDVADGPQDEATDGGLESGDADRAAHLTTGPGERRLRLLEFGEDRGPVGDEQLALRGEADSSTNRFEERNSCFLLEHSELLGHR